MRAIKFRLWDTVNKRMVAQPFVLFPDHRGFFWRDTPTNMPPMRSDLDGVLMQYTGLQDRYGKDIYEGDIVQEKDWIDEIVRNRSSVRPQVVQWHDALCGFEPFCFYDSHCDGEPSVSDQRNYEIIGNIYEHPELLKS